MLRTPIKNDGVIKFTYNPASLDLLGSVASFEVESPHFRVHFETSLVQSPLDSLPGGAWSNERIANAYPRRIAQETGMFLDTLDRAMYDYMLSQSTENAVAANNGQVIALLSDVSGKDLGADVDNWRSWWNDQQGIVYNESTTRSSPLDEYSKETIVSESEYRPSQDCFPSGTPVRTVGGTEQIQKLKVGDLLLTSDASTGAVEVQPVTTVFHNPPIGMYKIDFGDETLKASGIHRFWRPGIGWTMARELKPGDVVRRLGGTARVVSIEAVGKELGFNVAVARNRSYFVGKGSTLVHDGNLVETVEEPFDAPRLPAARP